MEEECEWMHEEVEDPPCLAAYEGRTAKEEQTEAPWGKIVEGKFEREMARRIDAPLEVENPNACRHRKKGHSWAGENCEWGHGAKK